MTERTRLALAGGGATALTAVSLWPVFELQDWLLPAWGAIALVVIVGLGLRALGTPRWLVPIGQALVLGEVFLLALAADDLAYAVVPSPAAITSLAEQVAASLADIARYAAPVPPEAGLTLLVVGGLSVVALAVDVLAVTFRLVPWAGLPLLATYAVPAGVIRGGLPWYLFVPVAAGFLLLLVAEGEGRVSHWGRPIVTAGTSATASTSSTAVTSAGRRLGTVVIAVAVAVPAVLPALPEGVFSRGGDGNGVGAGRTIRTDNPIVDLRRDLVRGNNVEILRYRTANPTPEYVRRVTLDVYDGKVWQTSDRAVPRDQQASGLLPAPPGLTDAVRRTTVRTHFTVGEDLDSRWLPLTYPTTSIDIGGDWRFDRATLDVVGTDTSTLGASYDTTSLVLDPTVEELRNAGPVPGDLVPLMGVDDDTRAVLEGAIREAIRDPNATAYDKAVAIQNWLRTFRYDQSRRAGNSDAALSDFLADRSGYCEQFAATMALMARAEDIPARVAVGFLPGAPDANGDWVVRANDAHAWPELYFDGVGWVRFEPTPADRTGTPPPWTAPAVVRGPTASYAPNSQPTSSSSATAQRRPGDENLGAAGGASTNEPVPWGRITVALALVLALAVTPAAGLVARRRRWLRAARVPGGEAEAAWADLRDAVRDVRLSWDPARTPRSQVAALAAEARLPNPARRALARLARAIEQVRYAPAPEHSPPDPDLREEAATVRRELLARAGARARWMSRIVPVAGRDAVRRALRLGGSGLDELEVAAHRLRERIPAGSR